MQASMSNEKAQARSRIRSRAAAFLAAAAAGLLVVQFFFPFVTFRPDDTAYTFTSLQMVTGFLRFQETAVAVPWTGKLAVLLPPLLAAAGLILLFLRRTGVSAVCFTLAALAGIAAMMVCNAMSSVFMQAGASVMSTAFHWPLAAVPLCGIAAAVAVQATKGAERLMEAVFRVFACLSVGSVAVITLYMIAAGAPAIAEIGLFEFLTGTVWSPNQGQYGILYMILASIAGMGGAILIGVPVGVLTAAFLAELAPRRLAGLVRPAVELLAGIPSVIYGFFGMMVVVPFIRRMFPRSIGDSLLAMILILAVMVLPTIIQVSETALRAVPASYREASLALGNTRIGTIFRVMLPAARSGILAGVILGVGRAIGETMAVIMVCGNTVNFPELLKAVRPLTTGVVLELSYSSGLHRQALFSIGLVLFIFIMIVNIAFTALSKRGVRIDGKE